MRVLPMLMLVLATVAYASEVQSLDGAKEEVKVQTGEFFSALQTSGSFTMMQAGGFEEELGDSNRPGAGGASASVTTAATSKKKVINPVLTAKPGSAGGAACAPYGTMKCEESKGGGLSPSKCPDDKININGKWWGLAANTGKGTCSDFQAEIALDRSTVTVTQSTAGKMTDKVLVAQKPFVGHPHDASKDVGVFGLKRVSCTGGGDGKDLNCETFKVAWCVKCPSRTGFKGFAGTAQHTYTKADGKEFVKHCIAPAFPLLLKGEIQSGFQCSGDDQKYAQFFIMTV